MKHTQGKWEVIFETFPKEPKNIITGVGINEEIIGGIYTTVICESILPRSDEEYIKQHDQIEADMKLIAAAPDLLEALIAIRKQFHEYLSMFPNKHVIKDIECIKQTDLAIKKATE